MNITDFDYDLPESLIAQTPAEPRDSSRLLHLSRNTGEVSHHVFREIVDFLNPGDVLVMNNTRVIPARLHGTKVGSGGAVELLLLRPHSHPHQWHVLVGGKRINSGTKIEFKGSDITAEVVETLEASERLVVFSKPVTELLQVRGEIPLPPYIHTRLSDSERYQTIYSRPEGSAAAPTAGLHFTPELLFAIKDKRISLAYCTLHIGLDTFMPVKVDEIEQHHIHSEMAILSAEDASIINKAKLAGGRIIAVGTTTARTLETAGLLSAGVEPSQAMTMGDICPWRPVIAFERNTDLYIYPGYRWRVVDTLITNFHLPKSTLLMMISAFAGRERVLDAYEIAKRENYRFFSFGDAMMIT